MTLAPWFAAYLMPAAIAAGSLDAIAVSVRSGSSSSSVTLTDMIFALGATPMMPSARPGPCPWPAMSTAIAVPWTPQ